MQAQSKVSMKIALTILNFQYKQIVPTYYQRSNMP